MHQPVVATLSDFSRSELVGRFPGDRADRPQSQHERDACFGIEFRKRFVAFQPRIFFEFESFFFELVVLF